MGQILQRAFGFGDFVFCGFDAGYTIQHIFEAGAAAAGGDEGHVVLAEEFRNQPAGKTVGPVDYDRLFIAHGVLAGEAIHFVDTR